MNYPTPNPTRFNRSLQPALIEAVEHLTIFFWGPTLESCQEMRDGTFWEPFETLAPFLSSDPPDALARLKQTTTTTDTGTQLADQLEEEYVAAFVNRRGGIRASLYASSYHGDTATLMDAPARLMEKRFAAKGLQLAAERHEPADHLAIQLEFCYFLLTREENDAARQEAASFVNEALLPWVPQFCAKLRTKDSTDFYCLTAGLLMGVLNLVSELG